MLQRSQVLLEDLQLRQLNLLSRLKNVSISQLVRNYVGQGLKVDDPIVGTKDFNPVDILIKAAKRAKQLKQSHGPTDLALNHDHYLYGGKRKDEI